MRATANIDEVRFSTDPEYAESTLRAIVTDPEVDAEDKAFWREMFAQAWGDA